MNKSTKIILYLLLFSLIGALIFVVYSWLRPSPEYALSLIKDKTVLLLDENRIYKQTPDNSDSYVASAVIKIISETSVNPEIIAKNTKNKLFQKFYLPLNVFKNLKKYQIKSEELFAYKMKPDERLNLLRERLSRGRPIIILGEHPDIQNESLDNYILLLGFDKDEDEFYIYNPDQEAGEKRLTTDTNGELSGNSTWTSNELISFWQNGGRYGLYKWYAISASK